MATRTRDSLSFSLVPALLPRRDVLLPVSRTVGSPESSERAVCSSSSLLMETGASFSTPLEGALGGREPGASGGREADGLRADGAPEPGAGLLGFFTRGDAGAALFGRSPRGESGRGETGRAGAAPAEPGRSPRGLFGLGVGMTAVADPPWQRQRDGVCGRCAFNAKS